MVIHYTSRDLPEEYEVRFLVRLHCDHPEMPTPTHKRGRARRIEPWPAQSSASRILGRNTWSAREAQWRALLDLIAGYPEDAW